jgi:hypothetical protein
MPDIISFLDRATPDGAPPLDLDDLARRGRRRQQRRRATLAGGTAIATLAVALVALVAVVALRPDGDRDRTSLEAVPAGPNGEPLTEPVGSWTEAADPPFAARAAAYGGVLDDGRVVVWGGGDDSGDSPDGSPDASAVLTDGGIYDPDTDKWEPIPPAPVPPATPGGGVQLAQDRLAIVTSDESDALHAAVFDVAERRWIAAPLQTDITHGLDGMAWDGETLALVRIGDPATEGRPPADGPRTLRWQPGDDGWTAGSPAPLDLRSEAGAAFDGARLALWGGTSTDMTDLDHEGPDPDARADGAIYDLATDTWETIPTGPLPARIGPALAWSNGQLLVGGGTDRLWNPTGDLVDLAAYDPATQSWDTRPAVPAADGSPEPWNVDVGEQEGHAQVIVATPETGDSDEPQWFYGPDGWEQAPLPTVERLGDFWVATTPGQGNPGSGPFGLEVRAVAGQWLDAAEAPFGNRLRPTLVATGDTLVVVGGYQAPYPEPADAAWVFDLAG